MQVKNTLKSTKNFVLKHRVAVAVTLTSLVWLSLQRNVAKDFNQFLKDHDLFDEYYSLEDDVEPAA